MDGNQLTILLKNETGVSLSTLEQLDVLHVERNPYRCDCALKETIIIHPTTLTVCLRRTGLKSLCVPQQGTQIMNLSLEERGKPTSGTQHGGSALWLTVFVGLLSQLIYFW